MKKNKTEQIENNEEEKKASPIKEVLDFCLPIIIALIIAIVLKTCVFANAVVPTGSMLNTIQEGDKVIASRLAYIKDEPERYDIIIFKFPDDYYDLKKTTYYVKRVIGLPGETVRILDGVVYIDKENGETVKVDDSFITNCVPVGSYGPYKVPENSYFVMGDNRNDSLDSRFWRHTCVDEELIIGKVMYRYYPFNTMGKIE